MTNDTIDLDAFFTSAENKPSSQNNNGTPTSPASSEPSELEKEFSRLLSSFVNEDTNKILDDFFETPTKPKESFIDQDTTTKVSRNSLDNFLTSPTNDDDDGLSSFITPQTEQTSQPQASSSSQNTSTDIDDLNKELKQEEAELARAVLNFKDGIYAISAKKKLKNPKTDYNDDMLKPNYKPSIGKKIANFLIEGWDVLNNYDPENMKRLKKDANDEQFLDFASSLNDTDMQLVVISYVEILINLEICETKYEQMKEIIQKNKIKKELYEEYQMLQEKRLKFIEKVKSQKFPIDADKLINNYFKAAQKDPKGAFEALTKNPAMFTPIQFDKMKAKFFGLIKITPEDGIKMNRKIGEFIKKLKV